ncbi:MAG: hypothetical protein GY794_02100 [bacterium]|nr:hypothetical protein [bacterium]
MAISSCRELTAFVALVESVNKSNWVQTTPDQGYFAAIRIYSPKEAVFDGSWKLGDIVEIEMR